MKARLILAFLRLFAALPLRVTQAVGALIGGCLILFPNDLRRVSRINIARCFPEKPPAEQARLVQHSLIETGKTMAEAGPMWLWPAERVLNLVREVSGGEELAGAMAAGKGVVLAGLHLGQWEILGFYASSRYAAIGIYRPPRIQELDALMRHSRERFGGRMMPPDARGVRGIYQALARGELAWLPPDQEPDEGHGVFAPFFGIPAYSMVLLPRMAARTNAAVFFGYAERLPRGRGFHLHFVPAPPDVSREPLEQAVAHMNHAVESGVRRLPEQYQWGYKRFRARPPGEARFYPARRKRNR